MMLENVATDSVSHCLCSKTVKVLKQLQVYALLSRGCSSIPPSHLVFFALKRNPTWSFSFLPSSKNISIAILFSCIWCNIFLYIQCFLLFSLLSCVSANRSSGVEYNRLWYAALALVTLVLFTIAVGAMVFMGIYYTHPEACIYNKVFLGINGSLCLFVSLLAISPFIQKCKQSYTSNLL